MARPRRFRLAAWCPERIPEGDDSHGAELLGESAGCHPSCGSAHEKDGMSAADAGDASAKDDLAIVPRCLGDGQEETQFPPVDEDPETTEPHPEEPEKGVAPALDSRNDPGEHVHGRPAGIVPGYDASPTPEVAREDPGHPDIEFAPITSHQKDQQPRFIGSRHGCPPMEARRGGGPCSSPSRARTLGSLGIVPSGGVSHLLSPRFKVGSRNL